METEKPNENGAAEASTGSRDGNRIVVRCQPEDKAFCEEQAALLGVDMATFVRMLIRTARTAELKFVLLAPSSAPVIQARQVDMPLPRRLFMVPEYSAALASIQPRQFAQGEPVNIPQFQQEPQQPYAESAIAPLQDAVDMLDQPDEEQTAYQPEIPYTDDYVPQATRPPGSDVSDIIQDRLRDAAILDEQRERFRAPVAVDHDRVIRAMPLGGQKLIGQAPVKPMGRS